MSTILKKAKSNKYMIWGMKILLCFWVVGIIGQALFIDGLSPFYSYNDYSYQNGFSKEQPYDLAGVTQISQEFIAKGNILDHVSVYFGDIVGEEIKVVVLDHSGTVLAESMINTSEYVEESWNKIGLSTSKIKKDEVYSITFSSENGLNALYCDQGDEPGVFGDCYVGEKVVEENLVIGFQFTDRKLSLGNIMELMLKTMFSFLMGAALCYCICKIETIFLAFKLVEKRQGFSFALYFAVAFAFLFNPLEPIRNEMSEFSRKIGNGVAANVDVAKRISNFNHWLILFAVAFVLFYMLANYFLQKERSEEAKKIESFLQNFMILANCSMVLRCITYFHDESDSASVYYFSEYVIMLIVVVAIAYLLLKLDGRGSVQEFSKLIVIGAALGYPIVIFAEVEWSNGRVLLGVLAIMAVLILTLCRFGSKLLKRKLVGIFLMAGVIVFPLIPLMTSLYIELIHILNQYSVFVAHPAKYYKVAVWLICLVLIAVMLLIRKKKCDFYGWKQWAFPWLVVGISCLSVQIPLRSTYDIDLFEGANYSVLISDFLNYGTIPLVEHYGGHMMTGVWEGILYGLINQDFTGAIVSPYSLLITPILVLLFYYLVREIWNEDMALFVALLFPFYDFWSYFGLGMLICLAAMAYVKKHSYMRASVLWAACIWVALYRLDLGFAFGVAVVISFIIYAIVEKNMKIMKELGLTLIVWGMIGSAAWCIICLVKGINPINRLIEFFMINFSNQNWALEGIGNSENTAFSWFYIIIPFLIIVCLIYSIFSKEMRERIGKEKWMLLMLFGWSYIGNFSRGLVRHSLNEIGGAGFPVVVWCSVIFLVMFLSFYRNNKKLFLPAFLILILCNTLFKQDENYIGVSVADDAASKLTSILDSWNVKKSFGKEYMQEGVMTYWEKVKYDQAVVDRVELGGHA